MRSKVLVTTLTALIALGALSGCTAANAAPAAKASSKASSKVVTCAIKGKAPSAKGNQAAKDLCRIEKSVANEMAASTRESMTKAQIAKAIPAGSHITVYAKTWSPDPISGGTFLIGFQHKGEKKAKSYLAFLVDQGKAGWKITGTMTTTDDEK